MSDSTSILDLPTDPMGNLGGLGGNLGSGANNINMKIQEQPSSNQQQQQPSSNQGMSLDQSTISQIVNSLQQASLSGSTRLPSRDIPMTTTGHSVDPQIIPNYVPPPPERRVDYIKNHENEEDIVNNYNKNKQTGDSLDDMYNEIQVPLLIIILYFLFQLPFFKKLLYTYIPFLFLNDGNYNINGYLFTSIAFGMLFHFIIKTSYYFGKF